MRPVKLTNVKLDTSGVVMASSMVSGNHWSCVHINLETGDGLYADSIGREVPRDFGDNLATIFKQYGKYTKKNLYQIGARCLRNSMNKKRAQLWIFLCKKIY